MMNKSLREDVDKSDIPWYNMPDQSNILSGTAV